MFDGIRARLRAVLQRGAIEREMQREMALHLDRATERFMGRGMSAADARLAAKREFGQIGPLQEEARDARGGRWASALTRDLRFAMRQITRFPFSTATIVLVLALGVTGPVVVVGIIRGLTTRPAPGVPDDPALVLIRGVETYRMSAAVAPQPSGRSFSYREALGYGARRQTFSSFAAWTQSDVTTEAGMGDDIGTARATFVTPSYFATIGVTLATGSGFAPEPTDITAHPAMTAIIGDAMWKDEFHGAPDVVGKALRVNGVPVTIIGVAPPRFLGAVAGGPPPYALWLPVSAWPAVSNRDAAVLMSPDSVRFSVAARLAPGVSIVEARSVVRDVAADATRGTSPRPGVTAQSSDVVPLRGAVGGGRGSDDQQMVAAFGAVAILILLICCTTVGSLLVAAGIARRREIGVRLSLGASQGRILIQLLTEISVLAIVAGLLGLVAYWRITAAFGRGPFGDIDLAPDWPMVVMAIVVALGAAALCAISPAVHVTRQAAADVLKDASGAVMARSRLQRGLVVAQIALTQPLLFGLTLLVVKLASDATGHTTTALGERVLRLRYNGWAGAAPMATHGAIQRGLVDRLAELPGVVKVVQLAEGVAIYSDDITVLAADRGSGPDAAKVFQARFTTAASGYFDLMDIPLIRGREFTDADIGIDMSVEPMPVVIRSDLAEQLWGNQDPVGKRFGALRTTRALRPDWVVVGEVDAARVGESRLGNEEQMYMPLTTRAAGAILIRTKGPAEPLIPTVRAVARVAAPNLPVTDVATLARIDRDSRSLMLRATGATAAGGGVALLLGAIGLYAVIALAVGQRRREIGLRIALGARPGQVVAMFLRSGVRLGVMGLIVALPFSAIAMWALTTATELPWIDVPLIGAGITGVVIVVAALATWLPARRVAGIEPIIALRVD